ncbi:hypothetical protein GCM10018966_102470 [Streptomyces yanii]
MPTFTPARRAAAAAAITEVSGRRSAKTRPIRFFRPDTEEPAGRLVPMCLGERATFQPLGEPDSLGVQVEAGEQSPRGQSLALLESERGRQQRSRQHTTEIEDEALAVLSHGHTLEGVRHLPRTRSPCFLPWGHMQDGRVRSHVNPSAGRPCPAEGL